MIPFILFGFAMLILVFIINYKLDYEGALTYDYLTRVVCTFGMCMSFRFSYKPDQEPGVTLYMLALILLTYPQLFAGDYVQYLKNKDDINACHYFIKQSVIAGITMMAAVIAAIYCYAAF